MRKAENRSVFIIKTYSPKDHYSSTRFQKVETNIWKIMYNIVTTFI